MDGDKRVGPRFSKAWRERIAANLPRELTSAHRKYLTTCIEKSIRRWFDIKPEIAPHREKLKRLATAVDKIEGALDRTMQAAKLGTDSSFGPYITTAEGHLFLLANRAITELARWNKLWRPKKARPTGFAVSLTHNLRDDFRLVCGNLRGFKRLLVVINMERRNHYPTLPMLTVDALEKRKQRTR